MNPASDQGVDGRVTDFALPLMDGRSRSLLDALREKRAGVVVFWSGVCSHCVRYDEYLSTFATRHPQLGLLAVACRQNETFDQVRTTFVKRRLRFPLVYDADRTVAHRWLVQQTPRAFLVDSQLRVLYRGAIDNFKYSGDPAYQPYLENAIGDLLAGRPVSRSETPSFGCAIESVYYSIFSPFPAS